MDGADPPIPSPRPHPSPSSFNHPTRRRRRLSLPDLSPAHSPLSTPSPSPRRRRGQAAAAATTGDPYEVTMYTNTRKRPRHSGSSSRSSGGGGSAPSPSPSPSSQSAMIRRTTSLSNLGQTPEPAGRAPTRMAGGEAAAAAAVTGSVWGAEMRRYSTGCFPVPEAEAAFLKACGLCKRGLGPGRDTFIYMGEVAFCSQECRQHQMNLDELKEKKCSGGGSDQSGKSSTIAAA